MFFSKKNAASTKNDRDRVGEIARALLKASGIEFDRAESLQQALVGTFLFGMVHAYATDKKLSAEQAHSLMTTAYEDELHYAPHAASEATKQCIDATKPGVHDTMNAIMHRGIDGYGQYVDDDAAGLADNIRSILEHFA